MEYILDEPGRQQLVDLLPNGPTLLLIEMAQALLHGLGVGSDVQGVLSDFPRYAWHVRGTPRKHVSIRTENVDEHYFLFGVKARADPQCLALGGLGVEEDELGLVHRLEASSVTLGVGDVLVDVAEAGDEGHRLDYSLGLLNALDVALIGVLACRVDGDDTVWSRHLELEVGVVRDGHELGVAWPSQNRVVGPRELDHIEGEYLPPEVVGVPNETGRSICPRGWARCLGTTPWNGAASFLSRDLLIPMRAKVST